MKHHLYQIYYGGFKVKLVNTYYCKACDSLVSDKGYCIPSYHPKNDE